MGEALDAVKRFYDAFGEGDFDSADALFADDCTFEMPNGTMNKAEHRGMSEGFRGALPDAHMVIDHALDAGNEVFVEGRFVGTHTGELQTPNGAVPATNNKLDLRFADYFKTAGGRIVGHRAYWDQVQMMTQLGLMPGG
jgi:steroid delta-isomerase-like uncharacterized protein